MDEIALVVSAFLTAKAAKGLSDRTIASYRYELELYAAFTDGRLPTTPEPIEAFLASRGPTLATRETYFRLLRNFYRWAQARGYVTDNPIGKIEAPKVPRKYARSLGLDELQRLLTHESHNETVRAFLYLLANTGVRLSEALSVQLEDYRDDLLTVEGKTGQRVVPISRDVWEMVAACLPWPWHSYSAASLAVRRAFKRAGFTGQRASAHTLRHTFVRLWDGDETLLVGILGWTSNRMLNVYRPYNVKRALDQHRKHNAVRLARQERYEQLALTF